uniref:Uncharacterized protein n=1 Tax=Kalmanozyma brasiliensis (strain GHG001) TaxID=1365824 RepID=V5EPA6_KALBG
MLRLAWLTLASALLLAVLTPLVVALPFIPISANYIEAFQARFDPRPVQPQRRYITTFTAPTGFRYSWGIDGYRVSYGTSSGQYISRSAIPNAIKVDQNAVNSCGALCRRSSRCNFFHPVEMSGSSEGNVICALFTAKQSKSNAIYDAGPGTTGGFVVSAYGFSRNIATADSVATSSTARPTTSTTTTTTSSSSRASSTTSSSSKATTSTSLSSSAQSTSRSTSIASSSTSSRTFASSTSSGVGSASSASQTSSAPTTSASAPVPPTATIDSLSSGSATNTTTMTTTTTAAPTPTGPPPPPAGATLVQFQPCNGINATVPMLVNKNYPINGSTSATTVWISQHGASRNFEDYFRSVRNVVGDLGVIIAPNFYASFDRGRQYNRTTNLAWNSNDWGDGADAVAPANISACSSFDVYDALLAQLADKSKFPSLTQIFIVAHSAGSAMMTKYGVLNPSTGARFVLANAPTMPYFTLVRPNSTENCTSYDNWAYGFSSPVPRYVAARAPDRESAFRSWIGQDLTFMTGDLDTYSRDFSGDQGCQARAQGGLNRRDRGYAWWAYLNLIGGTSTNVTAFYGYDSFTNQSVTSLNPPKFGARQCTVDGVAHDNYGMFASDCGRAALMGNATLPPDPGPLRPYEDEEEEQYHE